MGLIARSQFMYNQAPAEIMPADGKFEVIQTSDGHSIVLSLGSDRVLYLVREISGHKAGWTKIDLSSRLAGKFNPSLTMTVAHFAIAQNVNTLEFDIAIVMRGTNYVHIEDHLLTSFGNPSTPDFWSKDSFVWQNVPYDAGGTQPNSWMSNIYLPHVPDRSIKDATVTSNCYVEFPDGASQVRRYLVDQTKIPAWTFHPTRTSVALGQLATCGANIHQPVAKGTSGPGLYDAVLLDADTWRIYYSNSYNRSVPPSTADFILFRFFDVPPSAIASAVNQEGLTTLYIASDYGISMLKPNYQQRDALPISIIQAKSFLQNPIFDGRLNNCKLAANVVQSKTVIWWLNAKGKLFYWSCPEGKEDDASAWSEPIPIMTEVVNFAFYINRLSVSNTIFVHLKTGDFIKLTQDHSTSTWVQHRILLPAADVSNYHSATTFTSHIMADSSGVPSQPNKKYSIRPVQPTTAFVNGKHMVLNPSVDTPVTVDIDNNITVVEYVNGLTATSFTVTSEDSESVFVEPLKAGYDKIEEATTGDGLKNITIPTKDGGTKKLLDGSIGDGLRDAAAHSFKNLLAAKKDLPEDASTLNLPVSVRKRLYRTGIAADTYQKKFDWGPRFDSPGFRFQPERYAEICKPDARYNIFTVLAGDLFHFLKDAVDDVGQWICHEIDNVWHFTVDLAGSTYRAILNCVAAVSDAIKFVVDKLKVVVDDLVAWVGFLFQWSSILRTHEVMKQTTTVYVNHGISLLATAEQKVDEAFTAFEKDLDQWLKIPDPGDTFKGQAPAQHTDAPETHWATTHFKNGLSETGSSSDPPVSNATDALKKLLKDLETLATDEIDNIKNCVEQVMNRVVKRFDEITVLQAMKEIVDIVGKTLLEGIKTGLITLIDIVKIIAELVWSLLNSPLDIPILSPLYKEISGNELTILDALCLVGAVPATIIYKLTMDSEPFPDGKLYQNLVAAKTIDELRKALQTTQTISTIHGRVTLSGGTIVKGVFCFVSTGTTIATAVAQAYLDTAEQVSVEGWPGKVARAVIAIDGCIGNLPAFIEYIVVGKDTWYTIFSDLIALAGFGNSLFSLVFDANFAKYCVPFLNAILGYPRLAITFAVLFTNPNNLGWNRRIIDALAPTCTATAGLIGPFTSAVYTGNQPEVYGPFRAARYVVWVFSAVVASPTDGFLILTGDTSLGIAGVGKHRHSDNPMQRAIVGGDQQTYNEPQLQETLASRVLGLESLDGFVEDSGA